jgi:hypothetical protein
MHKRWILTAITVLGLVLAVSAALAAATLSGSYATQITKPAAIKGAWDIDFDKGVIKVTRNGQSISQGDYKIKASTINFSPNSKSTCSATGKYTFKLSGATVRFTKITDGCPHREAVLVGHTFTKA